MDDTSDSKKSLKHPPALLPAVVFVSSTCLKERYLSYLTVDRRWWRLDTHHKLLFGVQTTVCVCVCEGDKRQVLVALHTWLFVCVCVHDHYVKISSHHRGDCQFNLLRITTTRRELFGDNSGEAGSAHSSSLCLSAGVNTGTLLLLTTHTHTHAHTHTLACRLVSMSKWTSVLHLLFRTWHQTDRGSIVLSDMSSSQQRPVWHQLDVPTEEVWSGQRGGRRSGTQREGQIAKLIFPLFSYEGFIVLQVTAFRLNILHSLWTEKETTRRAQKRDKRTQVKEKWEAVVSLFHSSSAYSQAAASLHLAPRHRPTLTLNFKLSETRSQPSLKLSKKFVWNDTVRSNLWCITNDPWTEGCEVDEVWRRQSGAFQLSSIWEELLL